MTEKVFSVTSFLNYSTLKIDWKQMIRFGVLKSKCIDCNFEHFDFCCSISNLIFKYNSQPQSCVLLSSYCAIFFALQSIVVVKKPFSQHFPTRYCLGIPLSVWYRTKVLNGTSLILSMTTKIQLFCSNLRRIIQYKSKYIFK